MLLLFGIHAFLEVKTSSPPDSHIGPPFSLRMRYALWACYGLTQSMRLPLILRQEAPIPFSRCKVDIEALLKDSLGCMSKGYLAQVTKVINGE